MKKWLDEEYEFEVEVDALQQQEEACLAQADAIGGFLFVFSE